MLLLALETTCDETAAAIISDDLEVRSSVVATQEALHERFHGVVPEIADPFPFMMWAVSPPPT